MFCHWVRSGMRRKNQSIYYIHRAMVFHIYVLYIYLKISKMLHEEILHSVPKITYINSTLKSWYNRTQRVGVAWQGCPRIEPPTSPQYGQPVHRQILCHSLSTFWRNEKVYIKSNWYRNSVNRDEGVVYYAKCKVRVAWK